MVGMNLYQRQLRGFRRLFEERDVVLFVEGALVYEGIYADADGKAQCKLLLEAAKRRIDRVWVGLRLGEAINDKLTEIVTRIQNSVGAANTIETENDGWSDEDVQISNPTGTIQHSSGGWLQTISQLPEIERGLLELFACVCAQCDRFFIWDKLLDNFNKNDSSSAAEQRLQPTKPSKFVTTPSSSSLLPILKWSAFRSLSDNQVLEFLVQYSATDILQQWIQRKRGAAGVDIFAKPPVVNPKSIPSPETLSVARFQSLLPALARIGPWEKSLPDILNTITENKSHVRVEFFLRRAILAVDARLFSIAREWLRFGIYLELGRSSSALVEDDPWADDDLDDWDDDWGEDISPKPAVGTKQKEVSSGSKEETGLPILDKTTDYPLSLGVEMMYVLFDLIEEYRDYYHQVEWKAKHMQQENQQTAKGLGGPATKKGSFGGPSNDHIATHYSFLEFVQLGDVDRMYFTLSRFWDTPKERLSRASSSNLVLKATFKVATMINRESESSETESDVAFIALCRRLLDRQEYFPARDLNPNHSRRHKDDSYFETIMVDLPLSTANLNKYATTISPPSSEMVSKELVKIVFPFGPIDNRPLIREGNLVMALTKQIATTDKSIAVKLTRNLATLVDHSSMALNKEERVIKSPLAVGMLCAEAVYKSTCPAMAIIADVDVICSRFPGQDANVEGEKPTLWEDVQRQRQMMEAHMDFLEQLQENFGSRLSFNLSFSELKACGSDPNLCRNFLWALFRTINNQSRNWEWWNAFSREGYGKTLSVFRGITNKESMDFLLEAVINAGYVECIENIWDHWRNRIDGQEFVEVMLRISYDLISEAGNMHGRNVRVAREILRQIESISKLHENSKALNQRNMKKYEELLHWVTMCEKLVYLLTARPDLTKMVGNVKQLMKDKGRETGKKIVEKAKVVGKVTQKVTQHVGKGIKGLFGGLTGNNDGPLADEGGFFGSALNTFAKNAVNIVDEIVRETGDAGDQTPALGPVADPDHSDEEPTDEHVGHEQEEGENLSQQGGENSNQQGSSRARDDNDESEKDGRKESVRILVEDTDISQFSIRTPMQLKLMYQQNKLAIVDRIIQFNAKLAVEFEELLMDFVNFLGIDANNDLKFLTLLASVYVLQDEFDRAHESLTRLVSKMMAFVEDDQANDGWDDDWGVSKENNDSAKANRPVEKDQICELVLAYVSEVQKSTTQKRESLARRDESPVSKTLPRKNRLERMLAPLLCDCLKVAVSVAMMHKISEAYAEVVSVENTSVNRLLGGKIGTKEDDLSSLETTGAVEDVYDFRLNHPYLGARFDGKKKSNKEESLTELFFTPVEMNTRSPKRNSLNQYCVVFGQDNEDEDLLPRKGTAATRAIRLKTLQKQRLIGRDLSMAQLLFESEGRNFFVELLSLCRSSHTGLATKRKLIKYMQKLERPDPTVETEFATLQKSVKAFVTIEDIVREEISFVRYRADLSYRNRIEKKAIGKHHPDFSKSDMEAAAMYFLEAAERQDGPIRKNNEVQRNQAGDPLLPRNLNVNESPSQLESPTQGSKKEASDAGWDDFSDDWGDSPRLAKRSHSPAGSGKAGSNKPPSNEAASKANNRSKVGDATDVTKSDKGWGDDLWLSDLQSKSSSRKASVWGDEAWEDKKPKTVPVHDAWADDPWSDDDKTFNLSQHKAASPKSMSSKAASPKASVAGSSKRPSKNAADDGWLNEPWSDDEKSQQRAASPKAISPRAASPEGSVAGSSKRPIKNAADDGLFDEPWSDDNRSHRKAASPKAMLLKPASPKASVAGSSKRPSKNAADDGWLDEPWSDDNKPQQKAPSPKAISTRAASPAASVAGSNKRPSKNAADDGWLDEPWSDDNISPQKSASPKAMLSKAASPKASVAGSSKRSSENAADDGWLDEPWADASKAQHKAASPKSMSSKAVSPKASVAGGSKRPSKNAADDGWLDEPWSDDNKPQQKAAFPKSISSRAASPEASVAGSSKRPSKNAADDGWLDEPWSDDNISQQKSAAPKAVLSKAASPKASVAGSSKRPSTNAADDGWLDEQRSDDKMPQQKTTSPKAMSSRVPSAKDSVLGSSQPPSKTAVADAWSEDPWSRDNTMLEKAASSQAASPKVTSPKHSLNGSNKVVEPWDQWSDSGKSCATKQTEPKAPPLIPSKEALIPSKEASWVDDWSDSGKSRGTSATGPQPSPKPTAIAEEVVPTQTPVEVQNTKAKREDDNESWLDDDLPSAVPPVVQPAMENKPLMPGQIVAVHDPCLQNNIPSQEKSRSPKASSIGSKVTHGSNMTDPLAMSKQTVQEMETVRQPEVTPPIQQNSLTLPAGGSDASWLDDPWSDEDKLKSPKQTPPKAQTPTSPKIKKPTSPKVNSPTSPKIQTQKAKTPTSPKVQTPKAKTLTSPKVQTPRAKTPTSPAVASQHDGDSWIDDDDWLDLPMGDTKPKPNGFMSREQVPRNVQESAPPTVREDLDKALTVQGEPTKQSPSLYKDDPYNPDADGRALFATPLAGVQMLGNFFGSAATVVQSTATVMQNTVQHELEQSGGVGDLFQNYFGATPPNPGGMANGNHPPVERSESVVVDPATALQTIQLKLEMLEEEFSIGTSRPQVQIHWHKVMGGEAQVESRRGSPFGFVRELIAALFQCAEYIRSDRNFSEFHRLINDYMQLYLNMEQTEHSTVQDDFDNLIIQLKPPVHQLFNETIVANTPGDQLYLVCLAVSSASVLHRMFHISSSSLSCEMILSSHQESSQEDQLMSLLPYLTETPHIVRVLVQCSSEMYQSIVSGYIEMQLEAGRLADVDIIRKELQKRTILISSELAYKSLYGESVSNVTSLADLLRKAEDNRFEKFLEMICLQEGMTSPEIEVMWADLRRQHADLAMI